MYSKKEQQIIKYTREKVKNLFANYPVPAHGIGHVLRVVKWAKLIAKNEKANEFLCEMSAFLHDIGRTLEKQNKGIPHPELSYKLCRKWFKKNPIFGKLSKQKKIAILYAVRYHGNDIANKYPCAYILRDADKIDSYGKTGLKRAKLYWKNNLEGLLDCAQRAAFYTPHFIKTKTAKEIIKRKNLLKPLIEYYKRLLKSKIKPILL
jgi:uncharacterized protein